MSLSVQHIRGYVMLICLIIGAIKFGHEVTAVLDFSTVKLLFSFFFLELISFFGEILRDHEISHFLSDFHSQILASTGGSGLQ